MDIKDVIEFANRNKTCFLSTVDNNKPRVRAMLMWFSDETGFYFHTGTMKSLYKQLKDCPDVEICFFTPSAQSGKNMLRITGRVEFADELKDKLTEERPFTKEFGDRLAIFKVSGGEAFFWSMKDNTKENEIKKIVLN